MEWDTFATIMRDVGVSPHAVLQAVEAQVRLPPLGDSRGVAVEPAAKLIVKPPFSKTNTVRTRRASSATAWSPRP